MLVEIQKELDNFLISNGSNPFVLSEFLKMKFEDVLVEDVVPLILVLRVDGNIVGVAPISIRKKFGLRFVKMLFSFEFFPDFTFDKTYSEDCMRLVFDYIFNQLHCFFVALDLPVDSLNMPILERECKLERVSIFKKNYPYLNHSIIIVAATWDDFQKLKGYHFKKRFRRIEQRLSNVGPWRLLVFENENNEEEVLQRILGVEEASWKQNWRFQHNITIDGGLLRLWRASSLALKTYDGFKRYVWLLDLGGKDIAYSLVFEYKETAYFVKTSFNNEFRRLYPGIYTNHVAIESFFTSGNVKAIDFLTNLPFHKIWASNYLSGVRVLLCKGFLPNLLELTIQQPQIRRVMWRLIPGLMQQIE